MESGTALMPVYMYVYVCIHVYIYIHIHIYVYAFIYVYIFTSRTVMASGAMGWPRLVGSSKLEGSFAEYCLFYRALLQKGPVVVRSLLIVATPYLDACGYPAR